MSINPALDTDLSILKTQVAQLIELQKKEGQIPNPPNFINLVKAWHDTSLFDGLEKIKDRHEELGEEELDEEFDLERASERKFCSLILTISDLLKSKGVELEPPKQKVDSFPFKTNEGREMEDCWDRIVTYCLDIPSEIVTNTEAKNAKIVLDECLRMIEESFPPLAVWDTGEHPLMDEFYQHYFAGIVHIAIKRTREEIDELQEVALFKHYWIMFKLWVEFMWKKLLKKLQRK